MLLKVTIFIQFMIEKTIYLEDIDPVGFFGVRNTRFDRIRRHFPKLSLISRGNEIKIKGDEQEIIRFQEKMELLFSGISVKKRYALYFG